MKAKNLWTPLALAAALAYSQASAQGFNFFSGSDAGEEEQRPQYSVIEIGGERYRMDRSDIVVTEEQRDDILDTQDGVNVVDGTQVHAISTPVFQELLAIQGVTEYVRDPRMLESPAVVVFEPGNVRENIERLSRVRGWYRPAYLVPHDIEVNEYRAIKARDFDTALNAMLSDYGLHSVVDDESNQIQIFK